VGPVSTLGFDPEKAQLKTCKGLAIVSQGTLVGTLSDSSQGYQHLLMYPILLIAVLHFRLWHVGYSSLTRDQTSAPALGAQSLNHWTTRAVLVQSTLKRFCRVGRQNRVPGYRDFSL